MARVDEVTELSVLDFQIDVGSSELGQVPSYAYVVFLFLRLDDARVSKNYSSDPCS